MPVYWGLYLRGWSVCFLSFFLIHAQPKFRSHSHRNCLKIMGYFHQENIFDVTCNKNNSLNDFKIYRLLRKQPHHGVQLIFYDKFGSVLSV